tara:strand:- start:209 stop:472 length:264 start_codon:yes stop_codon:yes gene_type:complete
MILHTFNKPKALVENLQFVLPRDTIILIEDGVYGLLDANLLKENNEIFALEIDLEARGIKVAQREVPITYGKFVRLCGEADHISNWF